jgi:hypothetical protein
MPHPIEDQVDAATTEVREKTEKALGITTPPQTTRTSETIIEELLDRYLDDQRCQHLDDIEIQPSYWAAGYGWMCTNCTQKQAQKRHALGPNVPVLGLVEEHTCDRCRRYAPSQLQPVVARYNYMVFNLGCCRRCMKDFQNAGGVTI